MINSRNISKSRRGIALTSKSMFAIILVIFVFFMLFMVLQSRVSSLTTKEHFDNYRKHNTFFLSYLANSNCISVGNILLKGVYKDMHGVIDSKKLERLAWQNQDNWCIENFDFIYSMKITDLDTKSSWNIGIDDTQGFPGDMFTSIKSTLPCVIRYDEGIFHTGAVTMTSYYGDAARLYAALKEMCYSRTGKSLNIKLDMKINYSENKFYIGEYFFYPYFSCSVEEFEVSKGEKLLYLDFRDNKVKVLS
jgi:hypothetical protein